MSNDPKRNPDEPPEPPASPLEDDITFKTPDEELGASDDEVEPDDLEENSLPQDTLEPVPESEPEGWLDELPDSDQSASLENESIDPEQDPATDWDEPQRPPSIDESEWDELEDERQTLPPGRVLVGWREFVSLPQLSLKNVIACFDTTTSVSTIGADILSVQKGHVTLNIGGVQGDVPGAIAAGGVFVQITTQLAGITRSIQCRVVDPSSPHRMVFGRDAMEGYVVVDVALSFLHRRVGSPDPGQD
jgi:hypothetical protein